MDLGTPYVRTRTESDYWLYAALFSSTCPVALIDDVLVGAVVAFRSQDDPDSIYVQDVITHPTHRGKGVARSLLAAVEERAKNWGCGLIYLTSEPDNTTAHATWLSLGFVNIQGDQEVDGVSVISDYKGVGKHRAVYELALRQG
jgi:GNAT superfamily N-acetyltransferase